MPDVLVSVRSLGPRQFIDRVIRRYDWTLAPARPAPSGAEREALIDDLLMRRRGAITMPEWQGEPRVQAHLADLYAYLSARAQGSQGPGRPPLP